MLKIKYEYFCDECGKQVYLNSRKNSIHIIDDGETPTGEGLNYSHYIKEWDLCEDCFRKFNFNKEVAFKYLKENK